MSAAAVIDALEGALCNADACVVACEDLCSLSEAQVSEATLYDIPDHHSLFWEAIAPISHVIRSFGCTILV